MLSLRGVASKYKRFCPFLDKSDNVPLVLKYSNLDKVKQMCPFLSFSTVNLKAAVEQPS